MNVFLSKFSYTERIEVSVVELLRPFILGTILEEYYEVRDRDEELE